MFAEGAGLAEFKKTSPNSVNQIQDDSVFSRVIEYIKLEGTFKVHQVQRPAADSNTWN